jgi:predicted enzyme related to lactoylglutathione lyase
MTEARRSELNNPALGSFCWVELATNDQSAAKKFYTQLFNWSIKAVPMGADSFYTMLQIEGNDVAALYQQQKEQQSQGVPPHWMTYVAVADADQAVSKANSLGGKVILAPFDVFDAGRMAVLQDPTGAILSVWQARKHKGVGISGVHGTLCWVDLSTPDPQHASQFYSDLFGWKMMKEDEDPSHNYIHIANGEEFIGGISPVAHRDPNTSPHWLAYFAVTDCDATAAKAKELGATFHLAPMTTENVGRMAVLADPQAAVFAIFQAAPRTSR